MKVLKKEKRGERGKKSKNYENIYFPPIWGGEYDIRNADGQKNGQTNGILVYIIRYECMHISLLKKGTLTYL